MILNLSKYKIPFCFTIWFGKVPDFGITSFDGVMGWNNLKWISLGIINIEVMWGIEEEATDKEILELAEKSGTFDFLKESEEDVYTASDGDLIHIKGGKAQPHKIKRAIKHSQAL